MKSSQFQSFVQVKSNYGWTEVRLMRASRTSSTAFTIIHVTFSACARRLPHLRPDSLGKRGADMRRCEALPCDIPWHLPLNSILPFCSQQRSIEQPPDGKFQERKGPVGLWALMDGLMERRSVRRKDCQRLNLLMAAQQVQAENPTLSYFDSGSSPVHSHRLGNHPLLKRRQFPEHVDMSFLGVVRKMQWKSMYSCGKKIVFCDFLGNPINMKESL